VVLFALPGMGKSEEIIGMLLKETPEEERKKVVLATKCQYRASSGFVKFNSTNNRSNR
jgi:aryl-alcohol dehydrogenase-like predicted oxidoreductase